MALTFNQVKPTTVSQEQVPAPKNDAGMANVSIRVDADCNLLCDGEFMEDIQIVANQITKVKLPVGQHILEFMDVANPDIKVEKAVDFPNEGKSYLVLIDGLEEAIEEAIEEANKIKAKAEAARKVKEEAERKRVAAEQEKLRKQLTYTIKIIAVTNQLSAMFALRKALDWDAADTRSKLANLPYKVLETSSTKEAKTLYEQLADAGLTLKVTAINGLGEKVKADFTATAEAPAPAPASAKATAEVTFDVVLRNAGKYKLHVVKVVKDIAHLGLKEAKDIVDGAPSIVKKGVDKATAMRMKKALEDVGAKVEIV